MGKMKEHIAKLTYLDGCKDQAETDAIAYTRGVLEGMGGERQRIIAAASFTVKLDGNRIIVDYEDWKNLWNQLTK